MVLQKIIPGLETPEHLSASIKRQTQEYQDFYTLTKGDIVVHEIAIFIYKNERVNQ